MLPQCPALLEMRAIRKTFPGVIALDRVDLAVQEGEIHALVGENGAGKSTLMKVLSGVYPHGSFQGAIYYTGEARRFRTIHDSERAGIIIIHQELALVPRLSIAENLFLSNECARQGVIDWGETYRRARALLRKVGLHESPRTPVGELGVGKQQLVEIAKALAKSVRLLILDEPTASLNENDSRALLDLLLELKAQGMTCILISHKLNEIASIADSVTVLRDGRTVETFNWRAQGYGLDPAAGEHRIVRGMVGRELTERYPKRTVQHGPVGFEVRGWTVYHPQRPQSPFLKDINLTVRHGEIVGIAGLIGSGRTELAMSLFGHAWGRRIQGEVWINGQPVRLRSVPQAIAQGLAYVTEDRKGNGLVLIDDIAHNTTLANLRAISRATVIDRAAEWRAANDFRTRLRIRCASVRQRVENLSGGNQQKVVLGKWLFTKPRVLILDEPTRGIDVGAKYEIYTLIARLAEEGCCIVLISSEMPEILGMADRIYVMNEGRFVAEMPVTEASQEKIMHAIVHREEGIAP